MANLSKDAEKEYHAPPSGLEVDRRDQSGLQTVYNPYHGNGEYSSSTRDDPNRRNPFGLSAIGFGVLVATVTAVIVAAAVGGGVGGSCESFTSSNPSKTVTVTVPASPTETCISDTTPLTSANFPQNDSVTNYQPFPPYTVKGLVNDCTDLAAQSNPYTTWRGSTYDLQCGINYYEGDLDGSLGLPIASIGLVFAYTIEDCLSACTSVNLYRQKNGANVSVDAIAHGADPGNTQPCRGVTWTMDMAEKWLEGETTPDDGHGGGGNCYLKNGTVKIQYPCNECVSASLVEEGVALST